MPQFLYLIRGGDEKFSQYSPEEIQSHMEDWQKWIEKLNARGHEVSGKQLTAGGSVVHRRGELVTDGPYIEGKELVGGFIILTAEDEAEATGLSKECPAFDTDSILEIRPII
jgi:hypothetical protein